MKIELFFTHSGITESDIQGKTVVVIDVLRACTVIPTAFEAGCREVIPVKSIGDSSSLMARLDRGVVILAGEREGHRVEGFDLGNSPFEFTKDVVADKTIILASTNGSKALVLGSHGDSCLAGSFVNLSRVVYEVSTLKRDTVFICSGKQSRFALEDALCGGMMIRRLGDMVTETNDAGMTACMLYDRYQDDIAGVLKRSDHGKYLATIGFAADIEYAARVDTINILPVWDNGRLISADQS